MSLVARASDDALVAPGTSAGLLGVLRRRHLLLLLVRKELRVRYRASVLGLAWSYVKPAVQLGVYYLGLGVILGQRGRLPDFAIYLFSGLVAINATTEVLSNATRSVVANAELVRKVYLPRELFPVSSLCVAGIHLLPQLLVLAAGAAFAGWRPDPVGLLALLVATVLLAGLGLAIGLLLSALNVIFRDVENIVELVLSVLIWTAPVLYAPGHIAGLLGPGGWMTLYDASPLTVVVRLMHRAFWESAAGVRGSGPGMPQVLVAAGVVAVLLALGQWVFGRLSPRFGEEL
ncbi:MAG TPA: ABC transporter permease [Dermatophilaceae bacterium]|nr:ABC transporter permease [Dermatophilaceae bacterium]